MTFADLVAGTPIFVDANVLVYHFSPHPLFGSACQQLLADIENQTLLGYTSPHIVGEVAHALMIIEALSLPGWGVINLGRDQRSQTPEKTAARRPATDSFPESGGRHLPIPSSSPALSAGPHA